MRIMTHLFILFVCVISAIACNNNINHAKQQNISDGIDSIQTISAASNKDSLPTELANNEQIKVIKSNFSRINSIQKWTKIKTLELNETTEGGEAKFYFLNGKIEKIVAVYYGEMFQKVTEFYLQDAQLSFVFEKLTTYKQAIYDNETPFDVEKTEEFRSYFEKDNLIYRIESQPTNLPFSKAYFGKEQERLIQEFKQLNEMNANNSNN